MVVASTPLAMVRNVEIDEKTCLLSMLNSYELNDHKFGRFYTDNNVLINSGSKL